MTKKKSTSQKQELKLTEAQRKIRLLNLIDTVLSQDRIDLADETLKESSDALHELNSEVRKFLEEKIESILSGGTKTQSSQTSNLFTDNETLVLKEFAQKMLVKAGSSLDTPKKPKPSPVMQALTANKNVMTQIQGMGFDPQEMEPEELRKLIKELEDDDEKRKSKSSS